MHTISHWRSQLSGRILSTSLLILLLSFLPTASMQAVTASTPIIMTSAQAVTGFSGRGDARDVDIYPVVAYADSLARYLLIWLSARNAASSTDGLDIYGLFLDIQGNVVGNPFRISDQNTVARNGPPTLASNGTEFIVAWTSRGQRCRIYVQRIIDNQNKPDQLLAAASGHQHSPTLIYQPTAQQYVLAYVDGDDYLPPKLFGATTDDCGNQVTSTSNIKTLVFTTNGDTPQPQQILGVTTEQKGAFRPAIAYSSSLQKYLIAWEDRRQASGNNFRFDLYTQTLSDTTTISNSNVLTLTGVNTASAAGSDYTNLDNSATWTPRPVISAGLNQFLVSWFQRTTTSNGAQWAVIGQLIPTQGTPSFPIFEVAYVNDHPGDAPTGYLAATYTAATGDYLVSVTAHLETFTGYFSAAQIQRVTATGQLLSLAGTQQNAPSIGEAIDLSIDSQLSLAMVNTANHPNGENKTLFLYGKHAPGQPAQDFSIWGAQLRVATVTPTATPTVTSSPTDVATVTVTPTVTPLPTITPTPTLPSDRSTDLYLPIVQKK
jgi:hypothetical protein